MYYDRTLTRDELGRMLTAIRPSWRICDATPMEAGHHPVYQLTVETAEGSRECYLKATAEGQSPACNRGARMQAILNAHTEIPVPDVYGVVDEHGSLPAPFMIQSPLQGTNYRGDIIQDISPSDVERLAHSTGQFLSQLHALDVVDAYGFIDMKPSEPLTGQKPSSNTEQIVVPDPTDSWTTYVADSATQLVAALEDTRFADEQAHLETVADQCADSLVGTFDPVVARISNSIVNVLLDPETKEITGMLDWEFCLAGTPAYDLTFVLHSLVDGFWSMLPDTPSYREIAAEGLLSGYEEGGASRVIDQYHANKETYNFLVDLHSILNFDDWFDLVGIQGERRNDTADKLRSQLNRYS